MIKAYAPDPYRPQVRIIIDAAGRWLEFPYEVNLWENETQEGHARLIAGPLDPARVGIDPLALL